jgi:hypothetical protein
MRWAGHVARVGDIIGKYRVLIGRPQERRPLGTPRWEDIIKVDFKEMEWLGEDFIDMAQERVRWLALVNAAMNLRVPQNSGKFLTSL